VECIRTVVLHGASEYLQMSAAGVEQADPVVGAPAREQAQVGRAAHQGVAGVAGQEPGDRISLSNAERVFVTDGR
jgi:hypothetical protein